MPYAPGHLEATRRRRYRTRRERLAVRGAALLSIALLALAIFSLTNHQRRTGHGCIDFSYSTMIGGAEMYRCGAQARELCATPRTRRSIDGDFQAELYAACRKGGLATGRAATAARRPGG